ncbi:helix-turn-helix domain-containing protein [Bilophila wadsworthia]|uniref:helix-turn-helix domain-containing protein n=1 Tax=Bilophila wadsworthia TaxID=35833 RepID=UPI000497E531|nr:helix-turn-helix transcriptional regulator [Bilophila wadsworthia]
MSIAERIREQRGNVSRKIFAEQIGIHQQTLYLYEKGKKIPEFKTVKKISDRLKISIEWLMNGVGPMRPDDEHTANTQSEQAQPSEITGTTTCARCELLEKELAEERRERRELSTELREVNAELRRLARENSELIKENAELRKEKPEENLTISELRKRKIEGTLSPLDEQKNIPPSDRPQPRT